MIEWLAETNNFGDTRDPGGLVGPTGLLIIVLLAAATIFLIKNMNSRLRRLPERFDPPVPPAGGDTESRGAVTAGGADQPASDAK